jgi:hypothetical protein
MRFDNVKKALSLFLPVVAVIVAGVIPARADIFSSASFTEQCPVCAGPPPGTAVDMMKVFIEPPAAGVTFNTPGLQVYTAGWADAGWVESDVNPMYSTASGPEMSLFNYILNFIIADSPATVAFNVDVYYFQNILGTETLIDSAGLSYLNGPSSFTTDGAIWTIGAPLNPLGLAGENQAVPEPTSILLLGSVIFGLAIGLRKKLA